MKREIYVFMDSVSRSFGEPFTMANVAELRRHFDRLVKMDDVPAYVIRDTVVLHLGTFVPDSDHPVIIPENIPVVVLRGDSYDVEKIRSESSPTANAVSELPSC